MEVHWTAQAKRDLRNIFDYYSDHSTNALAKQIASFIVKRTLLLKEFPELGAIDPVSEGKNRVYRSLIAGNQKIVYWIERKIYIITVFDCRQDPIKLHRRLT